MVGALVDADTGKQVIDRDVLRELVQNPRGRGDRDGVPLSEIAVDLRVGVGDRRFDERLNDTKGIPCLK